MLRSVLAIKGLTIKHFLQFTKGRKLIVNIHQEASESLKQRILPVMRKDTAVQSIKYDRLIILYGNKICSKYRLQYQ